MSADAPSTRGRNAVRHVVAVAAGVGLFYASVVWIALDLLLRQASGPLGLNGYGWAVHLAAVLFPLLAFGVAFALGYRRRAREFALILLTGLGLSFVFWMNVVAYGVVSFSLYGG